MLSWWPMYLMFAIQPEVLLGIQDLDRFLETDFLGCHGY